MRTNRSLWTLLPVAAIAAMASGCATVRPMPLGQKVPLDTGRESVALMTVKTANEFKPGWQPKVLAVFVRKRQARRRCTASAFTTPTDTSTSSSTST